MLCTPHFLQCTRPLLFSRTLLSNLLNKIQFTSLLDFRPFQTIFLKVCINFSPVLRGGGRVGGEGGAGGEGGGKNPQVKIRGD